jgi:hypothetical protein
MRGRIVSTEKASGRIHPDAVKAALKFAKLDWMKVKRGGHPDSGEDCLYLEADVQQYSAFLAALAVQSRTADAIGFLVDQVQLQETDTGDTRFWFPGVVVRGF